ncbi:sigma 54-interacting transcriptional regulator [Luteibaculum oceani]|uniref:Magnesium chelatase n=1 Tax=Luteibaculum oceani TaxID=1294296 RepID=A0A5C6VFL1_9FLAO|nr:sigma 54-interacting transcriptional regulator [Luteibaculum oceani]TXC82158.1 magnesium chelatase [Luteibaculum oceani]
MDINKIKTLGELKKAGYQYKSIRDEIRANLIACYQDGKPKFEGIHGYEDSVLPQIENALLAGHTINLLGLRGQAKTKIARSLTQFLDPYIPVIKGSPLNEDPLNPVTQWAQNQIQEKGDKLEIQWLEAEKRYVEKLATPDVTIGDLIGDIDPIKAANLKLSFADEEAIHYGLVPQSNRCIFVINELPDLQARIQVALFNVLQESDVQIRGFSLRIPVDAFFIFTANPEDYTNRGSIITPLKDRIQSQILTHYPNDIEIGKRITQQEAKIPKEVGQKIYVGNLIADLVEQIAVEARQSEFIDTKSGVSARLTISAYETSVFNAYRRLISNKSKTGLVRVSDLFLITSAINGKVELVYEGEQEGAQGVSIQLIAAAIRTIAPKYFPGLEKKKGQESKYQSIIDWFGSNSLELNFEDDEKLYQSKLNAVTGLKEAVSDLFADSDKNEKLLLMELLLHGLSQYSQLDAKLIGASTFKFSDMLSGYFNLDQGQVN